MKTIQKMLFYVTIILMTSCSDSPDKMLTVINSDGSCYRQFSAYADSAFMVGDTSEKSNPFPVEIDTSYSIAWQYKNGEIRTDFPMSLLMYDSLVLTDTVIKDSSEIKYFRKAVNAADFKRKTQKEEKKKGDFLVFISQKYKSVEQLATQFKLKPSHPWKDLNVKYDFEKKLRFFYTYFSYKETYLQIELPFDIPIGNYMSKEEADFWFTGEPNIVQGMNGIEMNDIIENLGGKYMKWFYCNKWNMQFKTLIEHYDMIKKPPMSKEELILLKDTIFEKESSQYTFTERMDWALDNYFKTNVFSEFWRMENSPMGDFEDNFNNQDFMSYFGNEFTYQLVMPGEIIHTNGINRNDTLNWNLTAYRMALKDYTIEAQSQKLNIWMIILTGVLAITAIVIYVYRRKKLYK